MSTRERICALEPEADGLRLTTLRTADEVRDAGEIPTVDLPRPDPKMLEIAQKIIEQQAADFDPSHFKDRYEDALKDLIERKKKGQPVMPTTVANDDDGRVVDLMAALRKSLAGEGGRRERAERFTAAKATSKGKKPGRRAA